MSLLCCIRLLESGTIVVASLPWKWCLTSPFLKGSANKSIPKRGFSGRWSPVNFREPSPSEACAMRELVQPTNGKCEVLGEGKKSFERGFEPAPLQERVSFLFWLINSGSIDLGAFQRPFPLISKAMAAFLVLVCRKATFWEVI